jgi:hypothetical protein
MDSSKKMGFFDVVRVHVADDGDVELQLHAMDNNGVPLSLRTLYPSDVFYGVAEVGKGALDVELSEYGCDPQRAKEAIDEVITSNYHTVIKV